MGKMAMKRSQSKEAIRLWFECLKRADAKGLKINRAYYKGWGDWKAMKFEKWWVDIGQRIFIRNAVTLAEDADANMKNLLVAVPLSHTPTQAADELRKLLLTHYRQIGHEPKPERSYQLTEGTELKVANVRAYLHTYDIHEQLLIDSSKGKVTSTELLDAVRLFYLKRTEKWKGKKRKVDPIPPALLNGLAVNPINGKRLAMETSDNSGALRAIKRYLTLADQLIANAAKGDWPGEYQ